MKTSLINNVHNELKISAALISMYICILGVMFAVLLSMMSFSDVIPGALKGQFDEHFGENPYRAQVLSLTSDNAALLSELDFLQADIYFLAEDTATKNSVLKSDFAESKACAGKTVICTKDSVYPPAVIAGRAMTLNDNISEEKYVWLSSATAAYLGVGAGGRVILETSESNDFAMTVAGIYADGGEEYEYIINACTAKEILTRVGASVRQGCTVSFASYAQCAAAKQFLEENGCRMNSEEFEKAEDVYGNIRYMRVVFIAVAFVLLICIGILLYALNSTLTDVRAKYIAMLRCLGADSRRIVLLYFLISQPVVTGGLALGWLLSIVYSNYASQLMQEYLKLEISGSALSASPLVIFLALVACEAVLCAVFGLLRSKISSISPKKLWSTAERDG